MVHTEHVNLHTILIELVFMVHMHWQKGLSELPDIKSWLPATNSVYVHDVVYLSVVLCDASK